MRPADVPTHSCTPARSAVCRSIGAGPLGFQYKRKLRAGLKKKKENQCGNVLGAFEILLGQAVLSAEKHRLASLWWGRFHYVLGLPAAIFATVAGATALQSTSPQITSAVLALTAGGLGAAAAFLKCENSRDRNSALCAGWTELADQVRMVILKYDNDKFSDKKDNDYIARLLYLNKCKMELLWGALRAGPERMPLNPALGSTGEGSNIALPGSGQLSNGHRPGSPEPADA